MGALLAPEVFGPAVVGLLIATKISSGEETTLSHVWSIVSDLRSESLVPPFFLSNQTKEL
ncbi:MAG: hypothetical protein ABIQ04_02485 [Candidatus Saccharimonadales bacterium]